MNHIIIQGIPYDSAAGGKKGASFGPRYLRDASRDMQNISRIEIIEWIIFHLG